MGIEVPHDGLEGLDPIEELPPIGSMPNDRHQHTPGFLEGAPYQLAFVEFDDQGRCHDRGQMDGVTLGLAALESQKRDAIIVSFVHGWKHDARTNDENLSAFRGLLTKTVDLKTARTRSRGQLPACSSDGAGSRDTALARPSPT